jgi:prepilin-type N-terminal cleavage/methylation domain-containing protein
LRSAAEKVPLETRCLVDEIVAVTTKAFSLVEILVVIAVIAILSTLLLPRISGINEASHTAVARQQQAELQTALGNWIIAQSSGPGGLAAARVAYTGTNVTDKIDLLQPYLQASTYASLDGDGDTVGSPALDKANAYLQFSPWTISSQQPIVEWKNK